MKPVRAEQMRLDLREGTISDGEVVKKLPGTGAPLAFGDVSHDRDSRSTNLRC
jgi:hypothetical protein